MTTYIYGLLDPRTQELRYIGKTCNPRSRISEHVRNAQNIHHTAAVTVWVRSLLEAGAEPEMVLIEDAGDNWPEAEVRWIAELRAQGYRLVNTRPGGIKSGVCAAPHSPFRWWTPEHGPITRERAEQIIEALGGSMDYQPKWRDTQ